MVKALTDHPDWCLWLNENIRRGCDHTALVETLLKNDFDQASIRIVLDGRRAFAGSELSKLLLTTSPQRDHDQPALTMGDGPFLVSQVLTEKLQLYILPEFLSTRECQDIVAVGSDQLRASTISFPDQRKNSLAGENKDTSPAYIDPDYRTSQTCDLSLLGNDFVKAVDDKICGAMGIPAQFSEGTQLQRYDVGQQFRQHTDYFATATDEYAAFCAEKGNRTWTFMIYLNDVLQGGGTHFFAINQTILPRRGTAIAWNNRYPDGQVNPDTLHAGLPVEEGCKLIITKWFRER
jgi:prolyl 4-hydroxylase